MAFPLVPGSRFPGSLPARRGLLYSSTNSERGFELRPFGGSALQLRKCCASCTYPPLTPPMLGGASVRLCERWVLRAGRHVLGFPCFQAWHRPARFPWHRGLLTPPLRLSRPHPILPPLDVIPPTEGNSPASDSGLTHARGVGKSFRELRAEAGPVALIPDRPLGSTQVSPVLARTPRASTTLLGLPPALSLDATLLRIVTRPHGALRMGSRD